MSKAGECGATEVFVVEEASTPNTEYANTVNPLAVAAAWVTSKKTGFFPLVIQLGRGRREVVVPVVLACQDTRQTASLTRLPKNKAESHFPRMALATGALECVRRKVGVDDSETTCSAQGVACGPATGGCGGLLQCGTCSGALTCGGSGVPSVCG